MAKVEIALKDKVAVTKEEAAAMLSTSDKTIDKLVAKGLLKDIKVTRKGSSKVIKKFWIQELHAFCERNQGSEIIL